MWRKLRCPYHELVHDHVTETVVEMLLQIGQRETACQEDLHEITTIGAALGTVPDRLQSTEPLSEIASVQERGTEIEIGIGGTTTGEMIGNTTIVETEIDTAIGGTTTTADVIEDKSLP